MERVKISLPNGGHRAGTDAKVSIKAGTVFDLEGVGIEVELCTGNFKKTTPAAELIPFDLESAKAGAPLVTRDGKPAVFIAHDMGADKKWRVLVRIFGNDAATFYDENGWSLYSKSDDLFMAPKPKRTVWVNLFRGAYAYHFADEASARNSAANSNKEEILAIAIPIEIDA